MFTQSVEYALRTVVCLAYGGDLPQTTVQIAKKTLVPKAYLSKVIQLLTRADILISRRGIGGGVSLKIHPEKLKILDIVNAIEPIQRIKTCPLGLKAHGVLLCPLHKRMDEALEMVERAFAASSLAEILAEPNSSYPLCEIKPDSPVPSFQEKISLKS